MIVKVGWYPGAIIATQDIGPSNRVLLELLDKSGVVVVEGNREGATSLYQLGCGLGTHPPQGLDIVASVSTKG